MLNKRIHYLLYSVTVILFFILSSNQTYAAGFVPVQEQGRLLDLTKDVRDAVVNLESIIGGPGGDPDSLAQLLSGGDPQGIAFENCVTILEAPQNTLWYGTDEKPGTALSIFPNLATVTYIDLVTKNNTVGAPSQNKYTEAIQKIDFIVASDESVAGNVILTTALQDSLTREYLKMVKSLYYLPSWKRLNDGTFDANVNDSGSLRCLMQELVEWRKLDLNLTIHQMVKEYFADAGVYVMSKRIQDLIAAATTEWAQTGMSQTIGIDSLGNRIIANTSAFVDNPEAQRLRVNSSIIGGTLAQINNVNTGYQKYNLCEENVPYINNNITVITKEAELNSLETFPSQIACSDNSPAAVALRKSFSAGNYASGGGTRQYIDYMFSPDNPIIASIQIQDNINEDISKANSDELRQLDWGDGTLPTETCANPDDPYCRVKRVNTPGSVNSANITEVQLAGWKSLGAADEIGEVPGAESQILQLQMSTNPSGMLGYDSTNLSNPALDPIKDLSGNLKEFIATTDYYFGVATDTKAWAQNAVFQTWDTVQGYAGLEDYLANVLILNHIDSI